MPLVIEPSWIGRRISIRRVVGRTTQGREQYGDVVGELVGLTDATAIVAGRSGTTEVALSDVAIARLVPASTAEELALQRVMAAGWRAGETEALGRWELRAAGGFTRRANSVLVAGQPDRPLDDALGYAADWYAARGLPLVLQVPAEARRLLDAELGERGWDVSGETQVLVRSVGEGSALDEAPDDPPDEAPGRTGVQLADRPGSDWLALFRTGVLRAGVLRAGAVRDDSHAAAVLTGHPHVVFASAHDEAGRLVAVGRGTIDDGWLGLTALAVAPGARRQGWASAVVNALLSWGARGGAGQVYAAVQQDNEAGLALFEALGFWPHHVYRYRHAPH